MATAAEAVYWRAISLLEALDDAVKLDAPIKRLRDALKDYEASKHPEAVEPDLLAEMHA